MLEGQHALFGKRRNELNGEKRVATALLMHEPRERLGALRLARKGVGNQLRELLAGDRRQRDLCDLSTGGLDSVESPHQRMGGGDLVVSIGADQHEVLEIR